MLKDLGSILLIIPEPGERIIPLLHIGKAEAAFARFSELVGLINGTFFDAPHGTPEVWGDVLTRKEHAWGFPQASANVHGDLYFRPANQAPKPGYENRWGVAGRPDGTAYLYQGQPSGWQQRSSDLWAMGGGGLIVQAGRRTKFSDHSDSRDPLGLTTPAGGNFQSDVLDARTRSFLLLDSNNVCHLGAAPRSIAPHSLADKCIQSGYKSVVMLDGGGSTVLAVREPGAVPTYAIQTDRELQPLVGVFRSPA